MKPDYAKNIALKILKALNDAGIDALCVGGCPRDILNGKEVGDIDIVVRLTTDPDDVRSALTGTLDELSGSATNWEAELFSEYGEDGDLLGENDGDEFNVTNDFRQRIEWVYKFQFDTDDESVSIDVLAAHSIGEEGDLVSFLDTFDFTINQFAFDHSEKWTGNQCPRFHVKPIEGLTRCNRTTQRYKRLSAKYPEYDWAAVELFLRWTL